MSRQYFLLFYFFPRLITCRIPTAVVNLEPLGVSDTSRGRLLRLFAEDIAPEEVGMRVFLKIESAFVIACLIACKGVVPRNV